MTFWSVVIFPQVQMKHNSVIFWGCMKLKHYIGLKVTEERKKLFKGKQQEAVLSRHVTSMVSLS